MSDAERAVFAESDLPLDVLNHLLPFCSELTRFTFTLVSKYFQNKSVNPYTTFPMKEALFYATLEGHLDLLKALWLPNVLPLGLSLSYDLRYAAVWNGHIPILEWFETINPLPNMTGSETLEMGVFFHAMIGKQREAFAYLISQGYRCPSFLAQLFPDSIGVGIVDNLINRYSNRKGDIEPRMLGDKRLSVPQLLQHFGCGDRPSLLADLFEESFYSELKFNRIAYILPIQRAIMTHPLGGWVTSIELFLWRNEWRLVKTVAEKIAEKSNDLDDRHVESCEKIMEAIVQSGRSDLLSFYLDKGLDKVVVLDFKALFQGGYVPLVKNLILTRNEESDIMKSIKVAFQCGDLDFLKWLDRLHLLKKTAQANTAASFLAVAACTFPNVRRWALDEAKIVSRDENYLASSIILPNFAILQELVPQIFPKLTPTSYGVITLLLALKTSQELRKKVFLTRKGDPEVEALESTIQSKANFDAFLNCVAYLLESDALEFRDPGHVAALMQQMTPDRFLRLRKAKKIDCNLTYSFLEMCVDHRIDPTDVMDVVSELPDKRQGLSLAIYSPGPMGWGNDKVMRKYAARLVEEIVVRFPVAVDGGVATFPLPSGTLVLPLDSEASRDRFEKAIAHSKRPPPSPVAPLHPPSSSFLSLYRPPTSLPPSSPSAFSFADEVEDESPSSSPSSSPRFLFSSLSPLPSVAPTFSFQTNETPPSKSMPSATFTFDLKPDAFSSSTPSFTTSKPPSTKKRPAKSPQKSTELTFDDPFGFNQ